jgi:predicted kinase
MVMQRNNLVFVLLVGIPCAGKTSWLKEHRENLRKYFNAPVAVVSKDLIRASLYPDNQQRYDVAREKEVSDAYWKQLGQMIHLKHAVIVIDNTNVAPERISTYLNILGTMINNGQIQFYMKFFDVPLYVARLRNIKRKWLESKWVPDRALAKYYENYKGIDQGKYKEYLLPEEI